MLSHVRRSWILAVVVWSLLIPVMERTPGTGFVRASPVSTMSRPSPADRVPHYVQVVAHPDDDILFMNPDLTDSIRSGGQVTSVYLTTGESDVVPAAGYAAGRQAGTRSAFAGMARVPDAWTRSEVPLPGGRTVEVDTLRDRPAVKLVFVGLPDDNNPRATGGEHALQRLWRDRVGLVRVRSLLPEGTPLHRDSAYDHDGVVNTLATLYKRFAPTLLRTQDPQPDARYQTQWGSHHNHPDHVAVAAFAREARNRYSSREMRTVHYRDYNVADAAANLAPGVVADKRELFRRYAAHDPLVSLDEPYATWVRGMRHRWPRGAGWATAVAGGEIHAVDERGQDLAVRSRAGYVSVVDGPDVESIAETALLLPDPVGGLVLLAQDRYSGDVLVRRKNAHGDWAAKWANLRRPRSPHPETHIGAPAAAWEKDGALLVAVKNDHGGVSVRTGGTSPNGKTMGWVDLGGANVDESVSLVLDETDSVHVVAATRAGFLHWRRDEPSGRFELIPTAEHRHPSGAVAVGRGRSGRAYAAYSENGTGRTIVMVSAEGRWRTIMSLEPASGLDPALTVIGDGVDEHPVVSVRTANGATAVHEIGRSSVRTSRIPGFLTARPAFVPGTPVLVALDDKDDLVMSTRIARGEYGNWQPYD